MTTGTLKRALLAAITVSLLLVPTPGQTQGGCPGLDMAVNPFAFEELEITDTATPLTEATYRVAGEPAAAAALITTETAEMRYRVDGGAAPTASAGHLLPAGSTRLICGIEAIQQFRGIRTTSTSADLSASYFRPRR